MPVLMPFADGDLPLSIVHEYRVGRKSRIIYLLAIFAVIISLTCLTIAGIPTTVTSSGVIYENDSHHDKGQLHTINPRNPGYNELAAICYAKPSDIDLIKVGQEVRILMDGFDHEDWGALSGQVTMISEDIILKPGQSPLFTVYCRVDKTHLQYNGKRVLLKKGMTFTAEFRIARKSGMILWAETNAP